MKLKYRESLGDPLHVATRPNIQTRTELPERKLGKFYDEIWTRRAQPKLWGLSAKYSGEAPNRAEQPITGGVPIPRNDHMTCMRPFRHYENSPVTPPGKKNRQTAKSNFKSLRLGISNYREMNFQNFISWPVNNNKFNTKGHKWATEAPWGAVRDVTISKHI